MKKSRKLVVSALCLVSMALAGTVALKHIGINGGVPNSTPETATETATNGSAELLPPTSESRDSGAIAPAYLDQQGAESNEMVVAEYVSWMANHGYFGRQDKQLYESYSEKSLRQLLEGGDLLAGYVLFEMLINQGRLENAYDVAFRSAVYGSTRMLTALGQRHISQALGLLESDSATAKSELLKALAWHEVALKRGDLNAYGLGVALISGQSIALSSEEVSEVTMLAEDYLAKLEAERSRIGLPPFSTIAAPVDMDSILLSIEDDILWGRAYVE